MVHDDGGGPVAWRGGQLELHAAFDRMDKAQRDSDELISLDNHSQIA
jgi:hypothetical protein